MLSKRIKKIDFSAVKEELKKIGSNLITASLIGVFINHQFGKITLLSVGSCSIAAVFGIIFLFAGVTKEEETKQ
jgi:glucose uptake protein GlcU